MEESWIERYYENGFGSDPFWLGSKQIEKYVEVVVKEYYVSGNKSAESIAKSAIQLSMISMVTLVFSFVKESVFAYYFGTSDAADAYAIAIQLPVTLFSFVSTAISTVVIPNYSKELIQKSQDDAKRFASNLMTLITCFTGVLLLVMEVGAPVVVKSMAPGLSKETSDLACVLFRMVLPTILLTELTNINTGILNAHKSFALPSLGSIFLNIVYVTCVVLLTDKFGIQAAVIGTIAGTVIQFAYSILLRIRFVRYSFVFDFKDETMVTSLKMALPVFIGIGAAEINEVVDKIVSSFLAEGSIASLNYASKLSSAVSTLLISSIATIVYPEFSRCVAERRYEDLADNFLFSLKLYAVIILPLIFGGAFLSTEIITVVFKRGSFDAVSVARTAPIFACYLVCLLFTAIRQTSSRMFYSYNDSKTPMKNSFIGFGINIVLNIILAHYLQAFGLALATAISTGIISFLLLRAAKKRNEYIEYKKLVPLVAKVLLSAVVMIGSIYLFRRMVGYSLLQQDSIMNTLIYIVASVLIGVVIYFVMLFVTKTEEAYIVFRKVLRRKRK